MKFLEKYKAKILTGTRAERYKQQFNEADLWALEDCYNTCSNAKIEAYKECLKQEYEDASNYLTGKIISYNSMTFTYGYKVREEDGTLWLIIITYANKYAINLGGSK